MSAGLSSRIADDRHPFPNDKSSSSKSVAPARQRLFESRVGVEHESAAPSLSRTIAARLGDGSSLPIHVVEYRASLRSTSPLVLALPFTAAHSRQLAPLALSLQARGVDVVTIDPPGHGRSGGKRGVVDLDVIMHAVASVAEEYADNRPRSHVGIVGSSWGGDLALHYALWEEKQHATSGRPRRVGGVLAQAVITPWLRAVFGQFRPGMRLLFDERGIGAGLARRAIGPRLATKRIFRPTDLYRDPAQRRRFIEDPLRLRGYDTSSYLNYLRHVPKTKPRELTVPVHLLVGALDRLVPPEYERKVYQALAEEGVDVSLTLVPDAGHGIVEEQPDTMARCLVSMFGQLSRGHLPAKSTFGFSAAHFSSHVLDELAG
ncbi:Alpha/beta hydrolase family protein [Planctomycetes bacterium Pan216]|uniref:Alpha/beta hydrolase family protein n=1 Tax=Kolteria novifilia TaxID=2527975 RepID=A0A518B118_9BACT|nr:Alpha/beta hydrolase family protein [Planctomycetes bacterium Pan216]